MYKKNADRCEEFCSLRILFSSFELVCCIYIWLRLNFWSSVEPPVEHHRFSHQIVWIHHCLSDAWLQTGTQSPENIFEVLDLGVFPMNFGVTCLCILRFFITGTDSFGEGVKNSDNPPKYMYDHGCRWKSSYINSIFIVYRHSHRSTRHTEGPSLKVVHKSHFTMLSPPKSVAQIPIEFNW